jgi:tripartite-type tricarboxylate transporter receptor subunit TctC
MSVISRRAFNGATALFLTCPLAHAADAYPTKFIRLVLPFSPGGGTDTISRILGQKLRVSLKQPIVIDNRPGAAGNIATKIVARAPNDGYTLLMAISTELVVNPILYPDLGVNVQQDLAPISLLAEALFVLVVTPSLPVTSVSEFIDYARANPYKLFYTSAGVGSPTHLAAAMFESKTGVHLTHLPFQSGTQAVTALLTGEAQLDFSSLPTSLPYIQAGKLRALAVTSLQRAPILPNLPTMNESGLPGYECTEWYGVMAPAGTPEPIIGKLNADLLLALHQHDVQVSLANEGMSVVGSTPAELGARIKRDTALWAAVIKQANITVE